MLSIATMARIIISILLLFFSFQSHSQIAMFHAHNQQAGCTLVTPPLDLVSGALVAYGLRQLSSSATAAIRVRTASGSEYDVGFTACGDLDTVTLLSGRVIPGDLRVKIIYDQTGGGKDLTGPTTNGIVIVDSSGNLTRCGTKPSISFSNRTIETLVGTTVTMGTYFSSFQVFKNVDNNSTYRNLFSIFQNTGSGPSYEFFTQAQSAAADWQANDFFFGGGNGVTGNPRIVSNGKIYNGNYNVTSLFLGASNSGVWVNASEISYRVKNQANTVILTDRVVLGGSWLPGTYNFIGDWQELIIYTSDKSASRSTMEANINSYYSIY